MSKHPKAYDDFLRAKVCIAKSYGAGDSITDAEINPALKPHQRVCVRWMVAGGRRALFARFGLGKTVMQLEAVRIVRQRVGGRALIVCPLGVRQEFKRDAVQVLGWSEPPVFIRSIAEASDPEGIYLTNYETVRDGKLDPKDFTVACLDEAAILRGFGGTKTFREFMRLFAGDDGGTGENRRGIPYRFVATAAPSPNDYIELLAYAAYLGIMQVSEAKTRFFKRDSTKADTLTLHPHKEREFWMWVSSWALFLQRPSDLGPTFNDAGYDLPPLDIRWHEIPSDHSNAGEHRDGQRRMFKNAALGVTDASREKRESLDDRVAKLMELRQEDPTEHRLIWHDLEAERRAIESAIPSVASVYGSMDLDAREQTILDFSDGKIQELAAKPVLAGSGCNFQRYCRRAIFLGIGFKFSDFIQAVHRIYRFLQTGTVRIDLIYTEAERGVRQELERKWRQHDTMVEHMAELIREHGLAQAAFMGLERTMDITRNEITAPQYRIVNGDAIEETRKFAADSVGLIVTSIPFSTQYEYTPSYRDLGHTDDDAHFFEHLGYLTTELLRVLQPGRVAVIHVKDRIMPGGLTGQGFQTVNRFSDKAADHFERHGFSFLGRKTIVTDVVRENNQTYRLGWTEQCKDGSRMGAGMPEYLLIFRKPPTDASNGYADVPVVKSKETYSRAHWQFDAHGFMRSDGNRPITLDQFAAIPHERMFKIFRDYSLNNVYDFDRDLTIAESLDRAGVLPTTFMLLQPASWHPDVMTDIARMRTLNGMQAHKGKEAHLCPLQFDVVERAIEQYSQRGEVVFDPFGGLMTVPYCAIKMGRKGLATELNPRYFADGAAYCASAVHETDMPTLFDLVKADEGQPRLPGDVGAVRDLEISDDGTVKRAVPA